MKTREEYLAAVEAMSWLESEDIRYATPYHYQMVCDRIAELRAQASQAEQEPVAWRAKALIFLNALVSGKISGHTQQDSIARRLIKDAETHPAPAPADLHAIADLVEGMTVSVDVSTGEHDSGNRLFGTVTECMMDSDGKHGLILLVQDPEPNFKAKHPAAAPAETNYTANRETAPTVVEFENGRKVWIVDGYLEVGWVEPRLQACRPEDREMLATPAGKELVEAAISAMTAEHTASSLRDMTEADFDKAHGVGAPDIYDAVAEFRDKAERT